MSASLVALACALVITALTVGACLRSRYRGSNLALVTLMWLSWLVFVWTLVVRRSDPDAAVRTSLLLAAVLLGIAVIGLLANGIVMMRKEGRTLANLLSLLLAAALTGLSVVVGFAVRYDIRWLEAVCGPILVATLYLVITMVSFIGYSLLVARLPPRGPADAVVVLGSGLIGGRVPPLLAGRLDAGLAAWRRLQSGGSAAPQAAPLMIPSGGQGSDESRPEGVAMGEYLLDAEPAIDPVLRVEDRARTTRENLVLSRALVPAASPRLVVATSDYHVLRAGRLAHDLGLDATVVGSRTARYYVPSALLREYAATMLAARVVHGLLVALLMGGTIVSLVLAHR